MFSSCAFSTAGAKRLVCKACVWYAAYSVDQNWRPARVPKLTLPELKFEKEGFTRFEAYRDERRAVNMNTIKNRGLSLSNSDQRGQLHGFLFTS